MRKKIRRFIGALLMAFSAIFVLSSTNNVEASSTSKMYISYNVYKKSDYLFKPNFTAINGYDLATAIEELAEYDDYLFYDGQEDADDYWNGRKCTLGKAGYLVTDVRAAVDKVVNMPKTNTFKPGDEIAIEPMVYIKDSGTPKKIATVAVCINHKAFASDYSITTPADFYTRTDLDPSQITSSLFGDYAAIGFGFGALQSTKFVGGETAAGAIYYKLDSTLASGSYDIEFEKNIQPGQTLFVDEDYITAQFADYNSSPNRFVETKNSITIQGSTNETALDKLIVDGTTLDPTNPDSTTTVNVNSVPTVVDTYKGNVVSSNDFDIEAEVKDLGTITSVDYGTTAQNAVSNPAGSAPLSNGKYTVPTSWTNGPNAGDTIYVAVNVLASDGTTTNTYIIEVPKAKATKALLDDISFSSDGNPNSVNLLNSSGVSTSFSSNTTSYKIAIASDTTTLNLTPEFDTSVFQTCLINDSINGQNNTPSSVTTVSNGSVIKVKMTAQDGTTSKTYTFEVVHLSNDTSVKNIFIDYDGNDVEATTTDGTNYKVSNVPYSEGSFKVKVVLNNGSIQTVTIDGAAANPSALINFTNTTSATSKTVSIVVTAEDGANSKTYNLVVERKAAETDDKLASLSIVDNKGIEIGSWNSALQTYTVPGELDSSITSVEAFAILNGSFSTIKINNVLTDNVVLNFTSGANASTVTFKIEITSEVGGTPRTITVNVTREKAKATTALLDDINFSSDGTPNSVKLLDSSGVSTSFSPNDLNYKIAIASDTTILNITPEFDTSLSQTCLINDTIIGQNNMPSSVMTVSNGSVIKVKMTAQDGTTSKTYTFTVVHLSNDTSLKNIFVDYAGSDVAAITTDGTNYKVSNVPYSSPGFKVKVVLNNGNIQTVTIDSAAANPSALINFTSTTSATSKTVSIVVTAEDGANSKTYNLVVEREAAETDDKLSSLSFVDSIGNEIGSWNSALQSYTVPGELDTSITSVKAYAILNGSFSTIKINNVLTDNHVMNFTPGVNASTVTFTIEITSEAGGTPRKITVSFTRAQANDDSSFTIVANSDVDQANGSNVIPMTTSGTNTSNVTHLIYETGSITFTITPTASTTKIIIGGVDFTNKPYTYTYPNGSTSVNMQQPEINVTIQTEANPTGTLHKIKLIRAQAEDDYAFSNFVLKDSLGNIYTATIKGDVYEYTIPQAVAGNSYYLDVTAHSSKASIFTSTSSNSLKQNAYAGSTTSYAIGTDLFVTVYSQYGNKETRQIKTNFTDTRDTDNSIINITISGNPSFVFSQSDYLYTIANGKGITVPFSTEYITFNITLGSSKASLVLGANGASNPLTEGSNTFRFQARAENLQTGSIYEIEIYRSSGSIDDYLETLKINNIDTAVINPNNNQIAFDKYSTNVFDFVLPRNTSQATLNFTTSLRSTFQVSSPGVTSITSGGQFRVNLTAGGVVQVTFTVKSEKSSLDGGIANTYIINIYAADQDYSISDISILDKANGTDVADVNNNSFTFNSSNATQATFNVAYSISNAYLEVIASQYVNIIGNGLISVDEGSKTYVVTSKSEYAMLNSNITNQTKTYNIVIERNSADTTNTLSDLSFIIDGQEYITTFNPTSTQPYLVSNIPQSVTQGTVTITHTSKYSTARGDIGTISLDLVSNSSQTLHIYVKSEAGVEREYQIIVSRGVVVLDNNNEITNITVSNATKQYITYNALTATYNVNIPGTVAGLNIMAIKAATTSTLLFNGNPTVSGQEYLVINAGQAMTFTIQCEAQDGTLGTLYTINISKASLDDDATLSDLKINGDSIIGFQPNNSGPYTIYLPNNITDVILTGTTTKSTSFITSNDAPTATPYQISVGNNTITITVTAEDPTKTKTYSITVVRDADNTLSDLQVLVNGNNEITFDGTDLYQVNVPYSVNSINVTALANGGNLVTVSGTGTLSLVEGLNTFVVEVETASGIIKEYTIEVTRDAGKTDAYIETYIKEDSKDLDELNKAVFAYTYKVDRSVTTFAPTYTVSDGATATILSSINLAIGKNVIEIDVTSETGVTNTYEFTIYRADYDASITDIEALVSASGTDLKDVYDSTKFVDYDPATYTYSLKVAHNTSNYYLAISPAGYNAVIKLNGSTFINSLVSLNPGINTFKIEVISEYGIHNPSDLTGKSQEYTIIIDREVPNSDATLSDLRVMLNGTNLITNFAPGTTSYVIENIGNSVTSILIEADSTMPYPKSVISGHIGNQKLDALNVTTVTGYVFNYTVTCTAEDGTSIDYEIVISRGPVALDEDNIINYIQFIDSNGIEYLGKNSFNSTKLIYEITLPYGAQSYMINADKLAVSPSTLTGVGQITINPSDYGTVKIHKVFATSQKGVKGVEYTLEVTIEAPSTDSSLLTLKADGVTVPNFNPMTFNYTLPIRPNSMDSIDILAQVNDPLSTITGTGVHSLQVGLNTFVIIVTAQDGTSSTYTINVNRDYPNPYLSNLDVVGEQLLGENDKAIVFDKETKTYHVIVIYMTLNVSINATVDNPNYIVACSNSSSSSKNGTVTTFNATALSEGTNNFTITVTSTESNKSVEYKLVIQRRGLLSTNTSVASVNIIEIAQFKTDYSNLIKKYEYEVDNKIRNLTVEVVCEKIADANGDGATYKVFNDKNLKVGVNEVIILITAEDGETTRAIVVYVTRKAMDFTVKTDATDFECVKDNSQPDKYIINLKDKNATDIEDYKKYIQFAEEDKLDVKVLSDITQKDCKEVIISVSDGYEERLVTFQLNTIATSTGSISAWVWVILGIALVLLIIILISVNRDKYGSISKNRKQLK